MNLLLRGAKVFPDVKVECYGCGHKPHQVGRCPERTLFTKQLCACTDTTTVDRVGYIPQERP